MQKLVSESKNAMSKILEGVTLVSNPVVSTIGPKGKTVIISESVVADYGIHSRPLIVTKDGFRVSKSINSGDVEIQVGCKFVQEALVKQMEDAGDATSSCALLTKHILEGGLKLINDGASPIEIVAGINSAVAYVCDELAKMATPINGNVEMIRQVATVCSNNDEEIGKLIAQAFERIGADGIIKIEESKGRQTTIDIEDGITFPCGWASPYFIPVGSPKPECILENPSILIYDGEITKLNDTQFGSGIMPLIQLHIQNNNIKNPNNHKPILILCHKVDGEALATMTFNNSHPDGFKCCAVELQMLGDKKREFMEDVAAATGGTFINELKGIKLENVLLEHLGQANKVIIGKDDTVIIGGNKDADVFAKLSESLKNQENELEEGEEKEFMRKRIARLNGSVAILSVGATTEVEMKEKKDRIDDSVRATRSATEEGVVCGGGTAFINVLEVIEKDKIVTGASTDFSKGKTMVFQALYEPLVQICRNAGVNMESVTTDIISKVKGNFGYNAKTGVIEDLVKAGIIEPVKSNRCALQNAASVCCQILSSQYMVVDTL